MNSITRLDWNLFLKGVRNLSFSIAVGPNGIRYLAMFNTPFSLSLLGVSKEYAKHTSTIGRPEPTCLRIFFLLAEFLDDPPREQNKSKQRAARLIFVRNRCDACEKGMGGKWNE